MIVTTGMPSSFNTLVHEGVLEALRVIHQIPDAPKKKDVEEIANDHIKLSDMKVNLFKDDKISAPSKNKYSK